MDDMTNIYTSIHQLQNEIHNIQQQLNALHNSKNNEQEINMLKYRVEALSDTMLTVQHNISELSEHMAPYVLEQEDVIPSDNLKEKVEKQQELIEQLVKTSKQTQSYLDIIDDSLDSFDEAMNTLAHENEILLMSLMRLKKDFDSYLIASIKEKVILTSSLSVMLHELIINNTINRDNYTHNFQYVIDEIVNIYKQNGLNLDFKDELATLDGTDIRDDGISIRIPNLKNDSINIPIKEESNIISLNEAKKKVMEKRMFKIKNAKKTKNELARNALSEDEKPKNNIIDALDKLKHNVINIDLTKKPDKGDE